MFTEPSDGIDPGGEMITWPQEIPVKATQLKLKFPAPKKGK